MSAARPHIASHTALRGVAALVVVGYHLRFGAERLLPAEAAVRLFERGYLWVDFFFLLSGFVLSYVYAPEGLPTREGCLRFYRARAARVWPLHALTLAALVGFSLATRLYARVADAPGSAYAGDWSALPANLLLVHAWGFFDRTSWNIPAWSISVEVFAYLCFPAFLLLMRRGPRAFAGLAVGGSAAFYLWIGATTGDLDLTVGPALLRCLAGFVLGMAIYQASGAVRAAPDALLSAGQLACVLGAALAIERVPNDAFVLLPFAGLVLLTAGDRGVLPRLLARGWLRRLGDWSYAIYLLHVPLILVLGFGFWRAARAVGLEGTPEARIVWIALVYGVTVALAGLVYERFEKPARRFLMGARPPRPRVPVPAP